MKYEQTLELLVQVRNFRKYWANRINKQALNGTLNPLVASSLAEIRDTAEKFEEQLGHLTDLDQIVEK